jgi:hypothetical protein
MSLSPMSHSFFPVEIEISGQRLAVSWRAARHNSVNRPNKKFGVTLNRPKFSNKINPTATPGLVALHHRRNYPAPTTTTNNRNSKK